MIIVELRLGPNIFEGFPDAGLTQEIPESLGFLENLGKLHIYFLVYLFFEMVFSS